MRTATKNAVLLKALQVELNKDIVAQTFAQSSLTGGSKNPPSAPPEEFSSWLAKVGDALAGEKGDVAALRQQAEQYVNAAEPTTSPPALGAGGRHPRLHDMLEKVQRNKITLLHETNKGAIKDVVEVLSAGHARARKRTARLRSNLKKFQALRAGWLRRTDRIEAARSASSRRLLRRLTKHWNAQRPLVGANDNVALSEAMYQSIANGAGPRRPHPTHVPRVVEFSRRLQAGAQELHEKSTAMLDELRRLEAEKETLWLRGGDDPLSSLRAVEQRYNRLHDAALEAVCKKQFLSGKIMANIASKKAPSVTASRTLTAGASLSSWRPVLQKVAQLENEVQGVNAIGFRLREAINHAVQGPAGLIGGAIKACADQATAAMRTEIASCLGRRAAEANAALKGFDADAAMIKLRMTATDPMLLGGSVVKNSAKSWAAAVRRNERAAYRLALKAFGGNKKTISL